MAKLVTFYVKKVLIRLLRNPINLYCNFFPRHSAAMSYLPGTLISHFGTCVVPATFAGGI